MFSTNSQLRSLVTQDGAMILNFASNQMISVSSTGVYVLACQKENKGVDQIISDLAKESLHDLAVITKDVHEFLEQLTERNLVDL
jgi:Coenzyme PQQ synthesis protein D (PqqD)